MIEQLGGDATPIAISKTGQSRGSDSYDDLKLRLRRMLAERARKGVPLTYEMISRKLPQLADDSGLLWRMLEELMDEDACAGRPFVSAIAITPSGNGLPGPWFFHKAKMLGRFDGRHGEVEAFAFHAAELYRCSTDHLS